MKDTWKLILQELSRIVKGNRKVNAPATIEEIEYLEKTLDVNLPDSFKNYLLTFNGQSCELNGIQPLIGYNNFLSIEEIIKTWRMMSELFDDGESIDWVKENRIKPVIWNRKWIPFTDYEGSQKIVIDLDPGKNGKIGQIFCYHSGMDYEETEFDEIISGSFEDFSNEILYRLKQNIIEVDDGIIEFTDDFIV
ncbi:SMI1/KNR4 family protein [Flavobacterium endoglycinae]|uniref:SMI1/KNR4 family protein n=1 Tax=Flavobacterium endoglycinae TaxID=2816357 RepID=A0ABX7QBL3_9FLAO|nr:SMI1/KNR4 family protein [Flavobacterium endoglycinae]QSW88018.1 SMI1/KNR4 family protein [Flavobacterium endoglycinae]